MGEKKGEKKKEGKKLYPMTKENIDILRNIEDAIKRQLASSLASNTSRNIDDKADEYLNKIFNDIELIMRTQDSWEDISNLAKIYHSYSSMRAKLSSFESLIYYILQKDELFRKLFLSIVIDSGKQYVKSIGIEKVKDANLIRNIIFYAPFISFLLQNVDCQSEGSDVKCTIWTKYTDKTNLDFIINAIEDILSEIKVTLLRHEISDSGRFAIIVLRP